MFLEITLGFAAMFLFGFYLGYSTRREEEEINREIKEWRETR